MKAIREGRRMAVVTVFCPEQLKTDCSMAPYHTMNQPTKPVSSGGACLALGELRSIGLRSPCIVGAGLAPALWACPRPAVVHGHRPLNAYVRTSGACPRSGVVWGTLKLAPIGQIVTIDCFMQTENSSG